MDLSHFGAAFCMRSADSGVRSHSETVKSEPAFERVSCIHHGCVRIRLCVCVCVRVRVFV